MSLVYFPFRIEFRTQTLHCCGRRWCISQSSWSSCNSCKYFKGTQLSSERARSRIRSNTTSGEVRRYMIRSACTCIDSPMNLYHSWSVLYMPCSKEPLRYIFSTKQYLQADDGIVDEIGLKHVSSRHKIFTILTASYKWIVQLFLTFCPSVQCALAASSMWHMTEKAWPTFWDRCTFSLADWRRSRCAISRLALWSGRRRFYTSESDSGRLSFRCQCFPQSEP